MSYEVFNASTAPATPAAGKTAIFASSDDDDTMHAITGDGVEISLVPQPYNYVRNSGFWFAQRQAPGTLTTYSSLTGRAFTADGWAVTNENASAQYERSDTIGAAETGLTARFYGNYTKITSNGKLAISQVIEASDTAALRGQAVRVQLRAKTIVAASATWRLALVQLDANGTANTLPAVFISAFGAASTNPTLGTDLAYITPRSDVTPDNGTTVGSAVDIAVTDEWQRFGAVFDAPADCNNLVVVLFSDDDVTTTNGIALSEVSVTPGMQIVEWQPLSLVLEVQRVQRFYFKSFDLDTLPAQNVGLTGAQRGAVSVAGATANQPIGVRCPVAMWASLAAGTTFTFYNPSNADAFVRNTTAGTNATATASANQNDLGFDITFTGIAAWTIAQAVAVHYTVDKEL